MAYLVTDKVKGVVWGMGNTALEAELDVRKGCADFDFAADDVRIEEATPDLVAMVETKGGVGINWSYLPDGTACTVEEEQTVNWDDTDPADHYDFYA